jgi:hypothetical protein
VLASCHCTSLPNAGRAMFMDNIKESTKKEMLSLKNYDIAGV